MTGSRGFRLVDLPPRRGERLVERSGLNRFGLRSVGSARVTSDGFRRSAVTVDCEGCPADEANNNCTGAAGIEDTGCG